MFVNALSFLDIGGYVVDSSIDGSGVNESLLQSAAKSEIDPIHSLAEVGHRRSDGLIKIFYYHKHRGLRAGDATLICKNII